MEVGINKGQVPIISVENLFKQYIHKKRRVLALEGVSFNVNEGEFVAIVGESGSGKSTLLQILGGLERPSTGTVVVDGVDITRLTEKKRSAFRKKYIGYVFQFFYLQPFLTLRQNIELPLLFTGRSKFTSDTSYIDELVNYLQLTERIDHLPKELSGGQVQRVAIARALINRPKILLADEPTGNLDQGTAHRTIDLFNSLRVQFNTTIIIVTHDMEIASRADRIITLNKGTLL